MYIFRFFVRRCVQYVFDICNNELKLCEKFFHDGPLLAEYPVGVVWKNYDDYKERIEQNRLSHLKTLSTFLTPYLSDGELNRVCDVVNWLETMYLGGTEEDEDSDTPHEHTIAAQALLHDHLWPLSDALFIKAATEIENFKLTPEDLKVFKTPSKDTIVNDAPSTLGPNLTSAFPTVRTAIGLLVQYNDSIYDRPVSH